MTAPKPVVLVFDADRGVRKLARTLLRASGLRVVDAATGIEAVARAQAARPEVIVVDPVGTDLGVAIVRALREKSCAPIIVVSGSTQEHDMVEALEVGADDYLAKPFGSAEFVARVRAVMRRATHPQRPAVGSTMGGLQLDPAARVVTVNGAEKRLTRLEYRLLESLMNHRGTVVTQRRLLREIWGPGFEGHANYLREYVHQLRQKLEVDPSRPQYLLTEPGVGYRIPRVEEPHSDHSGFKR